MVVITLFMHHRHRTCIVVTTTLVFMPGGDVTLEGPGYKVEARQRTAQKTIQETRD